MTVWDVDGGEGVDEGGEGVRAISSQSRGQRKEFRKGRVESLHPQGGGRRMYLTHMVPSFSSLALSISPAPSESPSSSLASLANSPQFDITLLEMLDRVL